MKIREVSLKDKPKELLLASSKGTVPVLITENGDIIDESLDIISWAISNSNLKLDLDNNNSKNQNIIRDLIELNDTKFKYHLDRFKYSSRFCPDKKDFHKAKARAILLDLNKRIENGRKMNQSTWLTDGKETLADWAIWPFARQYLNADKSFFVECTDSKGIKDWINQYLNDCSYKVLMKKIPPWCPTQSPMIFPE